MRKVGQRVANFATFTFLNHHVSTMKNVYFSKAKKTTTLVSLPGVKAQAQNKMNEPSRSEQSQPKAPKSLKIQALAQKFQPCQYFHDATVEEILKYDRNTGISYLEFDEAHSSKKSRQSFLRALVIAADGACPHNGTSLAKKSSFGVFFGPDSPLNTYDLIPRPPGEKHTNNYAELMSVLHALELVKHHITLREWIIKTAKRIKHMVRKVMVVIIVDSEFVENRLTMWIQVWSKNGFKTVEGKSVGDKDLILRIQQMLELLSNSIDIRLWRVGRKQNKNAHHLAKRALQMQLRLPEEQDVASPSLRYFRDCIRSSDQRATKFAIEIGLLSLQKNCIEMHLGEIIMYMVMAGRDRAENFTTLFGSEHRSDQHCIMYWKLSRTVFYLMMDKPGHCSYPDGPAWEPRRSTFECGFAGGYPRSIKSDEAVKLQKWCLKNNMFSDGERLTSLLELIYKVRLGFSLDGNN
ncbi:0d751df8-7078-487a-8202-a339ff12cdc6-CDS [Sclerotinia trifoliorum]|uniref:ribonuclease H n=1 Tax=Sclerotinia trifoliorum TaxID=28548 RepID=A0A8H2ZLV5_9HELO|nr:0d751df8-7078-487a-8202-a339ff12cdc6-CDS [Sclerotinia trifoliorum]